MRFLVTFLLLACVSSSFAQKRKNVFPIWSYQARNLNISGISVGLGTLWENDEAPRNTNTNGIKLELIGTGILIPLKPDNAFSGIQIGLVNGSKKTRGIQIGLWNINERRKFSIINWNFKKQQ